MPIAQGPILRACGLQPMQDWDVEESRLGLVRTRVDGIKSRSRPGLILAAE